MTTGKIIDSDKAVSEAVRDMSFLLYNILSTQRPGLNDDFSEAVFQEMFAAVVRTFIDDYLLKTNYRDETSAGYSVNADKRMHEKRFSQKLEKALRLTCATTKKAGNKKKIKIPQD